MNSPAGGETFKVIFLKEWAPALITALLGGLVVAAIVPYVNHEFESRRVLNELRTRLVESMGEAFAGVVADTHKVRALEGAINSDKRAREIAKAARQQKELDERIDRRRRELRETEVALYAVTQKLESALWLAKLLFGEETGKAVDEYRSWRASRGETPIEAKDLAPHRDRLMRTMLQEVDK